MPLLISSKTRNKTLYDATGETPTVPTVEDEASPHWIHTDIYRGDFAVNLRSQKVWTRTDHGILELATLAPGASTIYIGPLLICPPPTQVDNYQNDLLIGVDVSRIIFFVNELRYPLLGSALKATFNSGTGTITLSGFMFEFDTDIFIIIKPL